MSDGSWVGYDLDKTTALYDSELGISTIGAPIAITIKRIKRDLAQGLKVKIFTARVSQPFPEANEIQVKMIEKWCLKHIGQVLEVTCKKDFACIRIYDDIAVGVVPNEGTLIGEEEE